MGVDPVTGSSRGWQARAASLAGEAPNGGGASPPPGVRVLLVDDQPSNLLALEAVLAGEGVGLVQAHSGEEALRKVLEEDFAAILMDVQMPGLDGFETAELIRERDRSRHTPILFLTAFQSGETQVNRGYRLGAVDFLAKPIVPAVLRAKVAVFVDLYLKSEQVRRQAARLVENQRREAERTLAEERRRWELDRLREEATREKRAAEALALKAEELTRSIEERIRAEDQLRQRATQQQVVAELGQVALAGLDQTDLLREAVHAAASGLNCRFARVMELIPGGDRLELRAGHGWDESAEGVEPVDREGRSLAAYTLGAGEPVVIADVVGEGRFNLPSLLVEHGVVGGICVAIGGRSRPYGTLGAYTDQARSFSMDDVHFLQALANVLAAALQRFRDEAELAAVRDELEIQLTDMTRLHALSERLSHSLELPSVLEQVLEAVTGLQGADRGVLMLHDRDRDAMTTAATVGFTPDQIGDLGLTTADAAAADWAGRGITAVISGGIVIDEATGDPVLAPHLESARRAGYLGVCSTPLLTCGGDLVGAIATYFPTPHRPSVRETRLVELYARQAAEFIDNARLYRAIQEADRRKGEFLAMLGHELRNPLAPVLNALHLMRLPNLSPEETGEARGVAERQVRHLARLVDDLLDVSRINSGKIELRRSRFDLRTSAARAVETSRPLIEARCHELEVTLPDLAVPVEADAARLEQVMSNLLNNAAKYTEPGGKIALELGLEETDAVVRVRDNGIGIAPDLLPRVFELFTQAECSLDRSQGGLGIGLTLVRRLVELHGGRVTARSEGVGHGSEFTVRVPLAAAGAEAPARPTNGEAPADDGPARRVLVVDDNVDAARVLARLLRAGGHEVGVAHDGPRALETATTARPDVVLLDIGLPGMDGYEVARRLRRVPGLEEIRIVALTGYGQQADRARSAEAGFDHHLVKPVDPETVRALIRGGGPLGGGADRR